MTQQYLQLLELLNSFEYKINEISAFRIFNSEYSEIVENSQFCILEKQLETELLQLSQMFDVSRKSAIILCAMFFNSFMNAKGLVSKTISEQDLMLVICLNTHIISELQEAILELEHKNILKVNSDQKTYELTPAFSKTIKF